jgi:hypothetical protein
MKPAHIANGILFQALRRDFKLFSKLADASGVSPVLNATVLRATIFAPTDEVHMQQRIWQSCRGLNRKCFSTWCCRVRWQCCNTDACCPLPPLPAFCRWMSSTWPLCSPQPPRCAVPLTRPYALPPVAARTLLCANPRRSKLWQPGSKSPLTSCCQTSCWLTAWWLTTSSLAPTSGQKI